MKRFVAFFGLAGATCVFVWVAFPEMSDLRQLAVIGLLTILLNVAEAVFNLERK